MLTKIICKGKKDISISLHNGVNRISVKSFSDGIITNTGFMKILLFIFGKECLTGMENSSFYSRSGFTAIAFAFRFDDQDFYFLRQLKTGDDNLVYQCDRQYHPLANGSMTIAEFREFLDKHYGTLPDASLWEPFVCHANTITKIGAIRVRRFGSRSLPRDNAVSKGRENSISLLKLFGRNGDIEQQLQMSEDAKENVQCFEIDHQKLLLPDIRTLSALDSKINELKTELRDWESSDDESLRYLSKMTSLQYIRICEIQDQIDSLQNQKINLIAQLQKLENSLSKKEKNFRQDYKQLQQFFPDMKVDRIEQAQNFHEQISHILCEEIEERKTDLEIMIGKVTESIKNLENEQCSFCGGQRIATESLANYLLVRNELQNLLTTRNTYVSLDKLQKNCVEKESGVNQLILQELEVITNAINACMKEFSKLSEGNEKKTPVLKPADGYGFRILLDGAETVEDTDRDRLLYDLSIMKTANLPFLVYDETDWLPSERKLLRKTAQLCIPEDRQVFLLTDIPVSISVEDVHAIHADTLHTMIVERGNLNGIGKRAGYTKIVAEVAAMKDIPSVSAYQRSGYAAKKGPEIKAVRPAGRKAGKNVRIAARRRGWKKD